MGYADHDDETSLPPRSSPVHIVLEVLVRGCGVVLIGAGLGLGLFSLYQAWSLFDSPERIERFAAAVERGSNIDKVLSQTRDGRADSSALDENEGVKLSYFFAWFVAVGLLLVAGALSFWAVGAGSALARGEADPTPPRR